MPASRQVLKIRVLNCGGMIDLMSEQEAAFLVSSLGLFRNRESHGRATPRANVTLFRAYTDRDFYRLTSGPEDLLHLIAHSDSTTLQTGDGKSLVTAKKVSDMARSGKLGMPEIVVSTSCKFQSSGWQSALREAGVKVLIGSPHNVTPANLTAFDMAFYSALLSRVRRGNSTMVRVHLSFQQANKYYVSVHAPGTPFARFSYMKL